MNLFNTLLGKKLGGGGGGVELYYVPVNIANNTSVSVEVLYLNANGQATNKTFDPYETDTIYAYYPPSGANSVDGAICKLLAYGTVEMAITLNSGYYASPYATYTYSGNKKRTVGALVSKTGSLKQATITISQP